MKDEATFNRLVNQLSTDAAEEKEADAKARRRRALLRKVGRGVFWLLLAGVLATGIVYREQLGQSVARFTGANEPKTDPQVKVKEVLKQVQKHMDTVEEAGK